MNRVRPHPLLALALVATVACARTVAISEENGSVAPVADIPITTASTSARTHFTAGEKLLDVGRPREAREHFRLAVEQDPTFTYGYLNLAASSASTQEFKENVEKAAQHLAGKSEGERLLVEINRTFLDNNAERRLELAQTLTKKYASAPRAWITLGNAQGALNQHNAARESYGRAIALDPTMFVALTAQGFSYLFSEPRDLAKAKQFMEQAIAAEPNEAKGYEFLGDVNRARNRARGSSRGVHARHREGPAAGGGSAEERTHQLVPRELRRSAGWIRRGHLGRQGSRESDVRGVSRLRERACRAAEGRHRGAVSGREVG